MRGRGLPSALLLISLSWGGALTVGAQEATPVRPNIVFIFTDDQRFDALGFLHPVLETPNLDMLVAQGVYFPNAFVTTPVCPSSRATVLTGLHERTHGFTFGTPPLKLELLQESYPRLLRDNGYATGFVGKNGAQLDAVRADLLFDEFVPVTRNPYIQVREGELIHATDYTGKKAVELIGSMSEPFMLTVWFNAPHAEDNDPAQFVPPERYQDLYGGIDFPDPPTSEPEFFLGLPAFLQGSLNRVRWYWRWAPEIYDSMMSRYLAMITGIDDAVGQILGKLVESGVADHTVVIFMSDNGYFIGERGFAGKWLAYEPSIRAPLLIYDPRAAEGDRGRSLDQLVLNIDIPETILDYAGIAVPEKMQGRSIADLIRGEISGWRQDFFIEHSFTQPPESVIPQHESLRTERMKYINYTEYGYEELYDFLLDPFEENDLAGEPGYQNDLVALRQRTLELKALYSGVIFSDGFESGDTDTWSSSVSNGSP